VPYVYFQPEIVRYLEVVSLVGATVVTLEPHLAIVENDLAEAQRIVPDKGKSLVALHPGASDPGRRWSADKFAVVGDALAAAGAHVVLADINSDAASATHEEIVVAAVTKTALAVDDSRVDILVNNVGDFRPAARRAAHVPRRVARDGASWSRGDRQQRNRLGVPRRSIRRRVRSLQRGRGGVHPQPGRRRGATRDPGQRDRPRPRRHGADARGENAAGPRLRVDKDLDSGGPVWSARRLCGRLWVPGIRGRAVRHWANGAGGRRHAGRFRVVRACRPQGLDQYAQRGLIANEAKNWCPRGDLPTYDTRCDLPIDAVNASHVGAGYLSRPTPERCRLPGNGCSSPVGVKRSAVKDSLSRPDVTPLPFCRSGT